VAASPEDFVLRTPGRNKNRTLKIEECGTRQPAINPQLMI
jgi:hypothetical protein